MQTFISCWRCGRAGDESADTSRPSRASPDQINTPIDPQSVSLISLLHLILAEMVDGVLADMECDTCIFLHAANCTLSRGKKRTFFFFSISFVWLSLTGAVGSQFFGLSLKVTVESSTSGLVKKKKPCTAHYPAPPRCVSPQLFIFCSIGIMDQWSGCRLPQASFWMLPVTAGTSPKL